MLCLLLLLLLLSVMPLDVVLLVRGLARVQ
jgi:hypothetical protein